MVVTNDSFFTEIGEAIEVGWNGNRPLYAGQFQTELGRLFKDPSFFASGTVEAEYFLVLRGFVPQHKKLHRDDRLVILPIGVIFACFLVRLLRDDVGYHEP